MSEEEVPKEKKKIGRPRKVRDGSERKFRYNPLNVRDPNAWKVKESRVTVFPAEHRFRLSIVLEQSLRNEREAGERVREKLLFGFQDEIEEFVLTAANMIESTATFTFELTPEAQEHLRKMRPIEVRSNTPSSTQNRRLIDDYSYRSS